MQNENTIMKFKIHLISIITFLAYMIQGCGQVPIKMRQIPELKGGSPLSGIEPVTFVFNDFIDEVGEIVGFVGGFKNPVVIDKKVTHIVVQTITSELKRNGHKILGRNNVDKTDFIIDGNVKQYFVESQARVKVEYTANVKVNITVSKALSHEKILSQTYSGVYKESKIWPPLAIEEYLVEMLNRALLNMVKDFTTDPDFLNILNR